MISELRTALAAANEKLRTMESVRVPYDAEGSHAPSVQPLEAVDEKIASSYCKKCSQDEREEELKLEKDPFLVSGLPAVKKIRDEWSSLLHEKREVQHKMTKLEQLERDFQHKICLKKQKNNRVEKISLSNFR